MSLIPFVIEKTQQGERSYDIFSRLLKDRIVFINGGISTEMSHVIVAQLLFLEAEDPTKDILMYINSPGGEVTAGMAILDTMEFIKCDVSTIVLGQAASMGSCLAQAGAPGKRFLLPHSRTMCHQPSAGTSGQVTDMEIHVKEFLKTKKELTQIYVDHNSKAKTYKEFEKMLERDTFLSPQETIDWGLADEIIAKR